MELEQLVETAIGFFLQQPATAAKNLNKTRAEWVTKLQHEGVERARAEAIFLFVPLAFSRHVLQSENIEITFPQYYVEAYSTSPKETKKRLGKSPLFRVAARTASRCTSQDDARKIASFSTEYQAIQNVISTAESNDVDLMYTTVTAPYLYHEAVSDRPWWKFW